MQKSDKKISTRAVIIHRANWSLLSENSEDLAYHTHDLFFRRHKALAQQFSSHYTYHPKLIRALKDLFRLMENSRSTPSSEHTASLINLFFTLNFLPEYFLLLRDDAVQAIIDTLSDDATPELIGAYLELHDFLYKAMCCQGYIP